MLKKLQTHTHLSKTLEFVILVLIFKSFLHLRLFTRKYSFFREQSFNVDALGVGGSVDETVIFSQDSFIPRSAAVNLTAQIFGHSFNVLEVSTIHTQLENGIKLFVLFILLF